MTRRIGKVIVFEPEPPGICESCKHLRELRPYGPRGEMICIFCAKKDPVTTERQMDRYLFGKRIQ